MTLTQIHTTPAEAHTLPRRFVLQDFFLALGDRVDWDEPANAAHRTWFELTAADVADSQQVQLAWVAAVVHGSGRFCEAYEGLLSHDIDNAVAGGVAHWTSDAPALPAGGFLHDGELRAEAILAACTTANEHLRRVLS